jgi:ADP-ribosylglycohydrolase
MAFGQYTDDTQLTRELAISLVSKGGFDPSDFAQRIGRAFAQNLIVGGGRATSSAARRISQGVPWGQAGTPAPAAGNGAAMRVSPIGLFYWNDLQLLIQSAKDQAVITHQAPIAIGGAVAVALAVSMCVNASGSTTNPREPGWWAWLWLHLSRVDADFADHLLRMQEIFFARRKLGGAPGSVGERDAVLEFVLSKDDPSWDGVSPWALSSVLWSLYCLSAHPNDLWEAILLAIWPGGDVDTTAAMAGAMVGAHVGIEKFPAQVLQDIAPKLTDAHSPFWDWSTLEALAARLHEIATRPRSPSAEDGDPTV